jgi:hypothetical protein
MTMNRSQRIEQITTDRTDHNRSQQIEQVTTGLSESFHVKIPWRFLILLFVLVSADAYGCVGKVMIC